jgi:hypothetical protein
MSYRDQYRLKPKFSKKSDDEILAILLLASDKAKEIGSDKLKEIGHPFELHPGEKALANEYLLIPSKLDGFCASLKCPIEEVREEVLKAIHELLEWPCPP